MKRTIILFIVLLGAVCLGALLARDPGYILIVFQNWTLESSLWIALLAIIILILLLTMTYRFFRGLWRLPSTSRRWGLKRQQQRAYAYINRGVLQFAQGQWANAEKSFQKVMTSRKFLLLSTLGATQAAHHQGNYDRCQDYLKKAKKELPQAQFTFDLMQAQLGIDRQQYQQSLIILRRLHAHASDNQRVLALLAKALVPLKDWSGIRLILSDLGKILPEKEYARLELDTYHGFLSDAEENHDLAGVQHIWTSFPKEAQKNPRILAAYVRYLLRHEANQEAYEKLLAALKRQWDDTLVELYGLAISSDLNKQLARAEKWLRTHPEDPNLLLTLGRLSAHHKLWDKARSYLEKSIVIAPKRDAYFELAQLLEQLEERDLALQYYREGVKDRCVDM